MNLSLIVPNNAVKSMQYLSRHDFRESAGVAKNNNFLFASTQLLDVQFSGWHALKAVCMNIISLEKPELLNWINNQHRVSTIYAGLDVPEAERESFNKHMGHSTQMNKDVYQSPLVLLSVTHVGRILMNIEAV